MNPGGGTPIRVHGRETLCCDPRYFMPHHDLIDPLFR